ncbi:hypothetical protein RD792_002044 [Penstemon davidsonii]|uniref:MATH domain-containing protein n=1 Tax=Penstemon davidsonii TaxID=160366 RepID=A0ABR0DR67_9LAMI|nr:hypothetical protein RD792_002044 [Penstemon davidsonii]
MTSAVFNSTRSISKSVAMNASHTLEIQGFSSTKGMPVGKFISSNTFSVGGHRWKIQFYPNGMKMKADKSGGDIYVSLYIKLVSKCEEGVEAYFGYVLFDQNGNKWHKQRDGKFTIGPYMGGPFTVKNMRGHLRFYKRTALEASRFITDDCLTIECTVGVVEKSLDVPKTFAQSLPLSDLGQSYAHLLESKARLDENIAVNTAASTLALAERHGCFQLKLTCLDFIGLPENSKAVMQTDGFKNLKENYPAVTDHLLNYVANGQSIQEVDKESFSCYRGVAHICSLAKRLLFRLFGTV